MAKLPQKQLLIKDTLDLEDTGMKVIGHHTCSKVGDVQAIESAGPFISTHIEDNLSSHKFLGTGYYFWDNNIGMAHSHGQNNYKRKYYIFEAELQLNADYFLDLVGNRTDMLHFQAIIDKFKDIEGTSNWTLAHYIEFLKRRKAFPYRAIRAVDASITAKEVINFVSNRRNFTNLNPIFIICLLDKEKDMLVSFKHIKTYG